MNVARIYAAPNGTIRHIFTDTRPDSPDEGTVRVVRFDIAAHSQAYNVISGMVKNVRHMNDSLVLLLPSGDTATIVDSAWIAARNAEVDAHETEQTNDVTARTQLLLTAMNALTQIDADRTAIATGRTAAQNASTLAQMRQIMLGMLDVMDNTCQRQAGVIKALRAEVRRRMNDT